MAKKINPDEELNTTDNNIPDQNTNEVKEIKKKEQAEPEITPQAKITSQVEIPPHVDDVLKSFRSYETLYVDAQGGIFTPDTPEIIRGKSTLYKNPYFRSKKQS